MKEIGRKLLRVFLMMAMVIGLLPGMGLTALAWEGDPYADLVNTTTVVNFDGKQWYLIENNSTAVDAGTVTLLSKECVAVSIFGSNNTYSGSTVETAVNNYYTNSISDNVKSAIVDSKMFLLTTDQANTIKQGNPEVLKCNEASGAEYNAWWLCSPGESYEVPTAAYVDGDSGNVDGIGSEMDDELGVRPALQLDLSRVTFDAGEKTFTVKEDVAVDSVTLDKTTAQTIDVDGKVSFTATVAPGNATDKTVKWSVGGTDTGAVKLYTDADCTTEVGADATDKLTVYAKGISAGSATVTVTSNADSTKSASCDVTVNAAAPSKLTLNVGENGKVVMSSGIYGNGADSVFEPESDVDIKGTMNVADGCRITVHEGANVNILKPGSISFYPAVDNTGTITAIPADGYAFAGWYNGETLYSADAVLDYKNITEDLSLTARFTEPITKYPLWVGGTQVTSENANNILANNTASYNADSNTLTLNGANITTFYSDSDTGDYVYGIYYIGTEELNIVLAEGSNNIVEYSLGTAIPTGIDSLNADVSISGTGTLNTNISGGASTGIHVNEHDLVISNSTVIISASGNYSDGILAKNVTFNDATVTSTASGETDCDGINADVQINGGTVTATVFATDDSSHAIEGTVKNNIAGTGWTDTAGTGDGTPIAVSDTARSLGDYKKVQFRAAAGSHSHDDINFTAWNSNNSLPDTAGNYYLTEENVTLSSNWIVPNGEINLCLNGKTISINGHQIIVNTGSSLNLYDCQEGSGKISGSPSSPSSSSTQIIFINGGLLNMHAGTITGNTNGGGVELKSGQFNMSGGTITKCGGYYGGGSNPGIGGVDVEGGIFNMSGGSITGNYSRGVYFRGDQFNLSGNPVITGNTWTYSWNIDLDENHKINIVGELTNNNPIGVSLQGSDNKVGVFTNSKNTEYNVASCFKFDGYSAVDIYKNDDGQLCLDYRKKITYDLNGATGTVPAEAVYSKLQANTITIPDQGDMTLDGFEFEGWRTEQYGTGDYYSAGQEVSSLAKDITLYAQWVHKHGTQKFYAWTDTTKMPTAWDNNNKEVTARSFALANDVTSGQWNVGHECPTFNLCLNGHDVKLNSSISKIRLCYGVVFDLYDCQGTGKIKGNNKTNVGVIVGDTYSATFRLYGGTITECLDGIATNGPGSNSGGKIYLHGGSVTGNTTGINIGKSTDQLVVDGNTQVTGNATNVNLPTGALIEFEGEKLATTSRIGVTMATPGVFTKEMTTHATTQNFISDNPELRVGLTENGEAELYSHTHSFKYSATDATITAKCINPKCDLTSDQTLTVNAPTRTTYMGEGSAEATITGEIDGVTTPNIVYKKGEETLSSAPTDAGTYTANITIGEGDNTATAKVEYTIAKATLTDVSVAQNGTLTYNGEAQTPQVTAAATAKGGQTVTFTYSKTQDGTYGDMPTVTNVSDGGTFYYKATASNHEDAIGTFTVTMNKGTAPAIVIPTPAAVTYDPNNTLANVTLPDGWTWVASTTVPTVDNNGYTAALIVDDSNYDYTSVEGYNASDHTVTRTVELTVNKAASTPATVTGNNLTYDGTDQALVTVSGSPTGGTMNYVLGESATVAPTTGWETSIPSKTNAGTYYVWYKVVGDENHNSVDPECLTVSIAKAKATITDNQKPKAVAGLEADETDHELVTAPAETVTGYSVKYSLDGTNWSDSIPTGKDAGTYTVKFKYVATDQNNYDDVNGDDISVKITTVSYTAIKGNGQVWTKGSTSTADIEFERSVESAERTAFSLFLKVQVDGNDVDASNYDKKEGSVIIKFKPAYLEKLSVGEHKVTAFFSDNHTASANFTVKAKSSDGGSSTPEKKTDNVVTCQMAGYPANYAWNEAAKACQPGYLDANGVFHSTARKSVVPGTYDRGVAGNVISLTVSAFFAISAFFLLRKYK